MFAVAVYVALGAMICWGFGDFLIQRSVRAVGNVEALAWIGIVGAVILFPFVLPDLQHLGLLKNLLLLLVLGIITFVAAWYEFEALKIGKLAVIDMVFSVELPLTIILGVTLLHEVITLWQFLLILFLFWGISLMSVDATNVRLKLEKGVWLAIVGACCMALVNFFTAKAAYDVSPLMAIWVPWVVFTLISIVVLHRQKRLPVFLANARKHRALLLGMGLFDTAAWLLYAYAISLSQLSITTAITESYPAIALFLGVWLNKERINHHQWFGAGVALVGSFLLGLTL